jgi:hypothetical protein
MKLMAEWYCAANDSMFFLPSWSSSPKAYSARSDENNVRASANVIHPRSSAGNADKEREAWPHLFHRASWHPTKRQRLPQIAISLFPFVEVSSGPITVSLNALPSRFPPPWSVEDIGGSFVVKASNDRPLVFIHYWDGVGRRSLAKCY